MGLILLLLMVVQGGFAQGMDLGGRTIRINTRHLDITPLAPRGELSWDNPDARLKAHIEAVEEMFNCKIEIFAIPNQERRQAIVSGILAGDAPADVFIGLPQEPIYIYSLAREGLLHPLDDIIPEDWVDSLPAMYRHTALERPYFGHIYAFTGELYAVTEQMVIVFNKDIFDEEAFPSPYDLVQSGEWTWDTFRDLAFQATKDTDGDGVIDQWGAGSYWNLDGGTRIFDWAMSNGGALSRVIDGRETFTFHYPEVVEAFEFWLELFERGVAPRGGASGKMHAGDIALCMQPAHTLGYEAMQNAHFDFGVVPLPMGPRADRYVFPRRIGMGAGAAIPITEKDPKAVFEVVNALYMLTDKYGDIKEHEEMFYKRLEFLVRDRESLETLKTAVLQPEPWNHGFDHILDMPEFQQAVYGPAIWQEGRSPNVVLAEVAPVIQLQIDELFGQ